MDNIMEFFNTLFSTKNEDIRKLFVLRIIVVIFISVGLGVLFVHCWMADEADRHAENMRIIDELKNYNGTVHN